ncbi:MAG: Uma2 family endonuclease [Gammaproteobacteria bacterium]
MAVTVTPAVEIRRFTRVEYRKLMETIFRPDERLELIDGLLVLREPQDTPHAVGTQLVLRALDRAFGAGWNVRPGLPLGLDDMSEPEPDAAVVPGDPRDYLDAHPERPVLIVEVSWSRLAFDRRHKASLYARAGIADYWIVNLIDRVVEVHREPVTDATAPYGFSYRSITRVAPPATVTPLAAPSAVIPIADLLP